MAVINEWTEAALEQGQIQGREQVLVPFLRLLGRVLGDLPPEMEQQVRKLSEKQLEELGDAVVTFTSLHDLQVWLTHSA